MNQPATFVHWSIFDVTVANLVLVAVMVAIFGAALLLPFPKGRLVEDATVTGSAADAGVAELPPVTRQPPAEALPSSDGTG